MLKVFLVEDEFVVREGIKNNVDWTAHGYEFCGEASDGELAFPMIQKCRPDIVITDIRMPFMDGLTLSKLIKKELPWTEIIILTGYEEFEYAKEGIKIGVARYLSKPISGAELIREMDALAVKIEEKQKERSIHEKYVQEMEENFRTERKTLFQSLVTGDKSAAELLEMADKLGTDLSALWYNIVLIKVQSREHGYNEYSNSLVEIEQAMKSLDNEEHLLIFDRNLEGNALLFKADSREELLEFQEHYLHKIKQILARYKGVRYFGGIGAPVDRLRELPVSFEKASHAFAHRYLVSDSLILSSAGGSQVAYREKEAFNMSTVDLKQLDRGKIREFLKLGEKEETIYFIEEFFNDLGANAMRSTMFRQYITMDAYFCVCEFLEELQIERKSIEPPDAVAGVLQDRESAMQYIVKIMKKALELRESTASGHNRDIVGEVIDYIEKHYADEELSLNQLSSHVNFSPNYLSMIFSQQTGKPFIKYLTDFRMSKAKELLRCTGKRSSEISVEVGYRDSHYFSYLFKKTQGMTPTQYRGRNNSEGGAGA
ncbi:response regulator [Lachnospiraceae bacterium JLR.KK008]